MKPFCSSCASDAIQHASDTDKLGKIWVRCWFVSPRVRNCPTPGERSHRTVEVDPLVNINIEQCRLHDNVVRSATDSQQRGVFCGCIVGRRELECLSAGQNEKVARGACTYIENVSHKVTLVLSVNHDPYPGNSCRVKQSNLERDSDTGNEKDNAILPLH